MIPVSLSLTNFTCHEKSFIDFQSFSSAVIVGQAINNNRRSNGVGKSKIFTGINYALFNQTPFGNIENIVRDGADKCEVEYVFMLGSDTFKIFRARGRKASSADVRFFKKNESGWEDLSERTSTQTEKAIQNVIKINYNTFMNSVHFGQNDLSGLALMSPGDRKKTFKEVLQLGSYSVMEKIAKKKLADLISEQKIAKFNFDSMGDLQALLSEANFSILQSEELKKNTEEIVNEKSVLISSLEEEIQSLNDKDKNLRGSYELLTQKREQLKSIINSLLLNKQQAESLKKDLKSEFQRKKQELISLHETVKKLSEEKIDSPESLIKESESISKIILEKTSDLKSNLKQIKESSIELPGGPQCDSCLQQIPDSYRHDCEKKIKEKIISLQENNSALSLEIEDLKEKQKIINQKARIADQKIRDLSSLKKDISSKEKEMLQIKERYQSFEEKNKEIEINFLNKEKELKEADFQLNEFKEKSYSEYALISKTILDSKNKIELLKQELSSNKRKHNEYSVSLEVSKDRKNKIEKDIQKSLDLAKRLDELTTEISVLNLVSIAFGTRGIPALIIHNILDDLQVYANEVISQIRPGLQLQFEIDKENSKGEQTDTLNISYSLNNREREYDQLSGAQKLTVTLGLRLGLSKVLQKNLGIDIKFLMLDEVDASLDEEGLDAFLDLVKIVEKDFKVMIITHNNSLKTKFNSAILVSQDENLNSNAKVINW